jgi:predicted oxidoreductase
MHRPDPLADPAEVGGALSDLSAVGKVRSFGVSNMSAGQIRLLQAHSPRR